VATIALVSPDTTDLDRWMGKPVGGGQLKDAVAANDIRRWAQAMHNPNPLHLDERFAAASAHGELLAPVSFAVCCAWRHAATPAIQGVIPGSHMLFGGDRFWFNGPRIRPGMRVRTSRLAYDYTVKDTRFAGPTVFQRGDTTYIDGGGRILGRQRCTAIRYLVENAHRLDSMKAMEAEPSWSAADLARIDAEKRAYYATFHDHVLRTLDDVRDGEELPTGVMGPHSLMTLTTEWRAYLCNIWGTFEDDGLPNSTNQAGWLPEMTRDMEAARLDPSKDDGLYAGASSGHTNEGRARLIGMPRAYGYGASMGSYVLDYVSNWAGELAAIGEADVQYRFPVLVGDVTYLRGRVTAVRPDSAAGAGEVDVEVRMSNQDGAVMATGRLTVRMRRGAAA
jgi:acyl dehydratase